VLRFADSSGAAWTGGTALTIEAWTGSPFGGGTDQLYFGTTSGGLTVGQVGQIQFLNPAGFAPGTYNAQILANGEVVPVPEPATGIGAPAPVVLAAGHRWRIRQASRRWSIGAGLG
jgi:hypothetical protein